MGRNLHRFAHGPDLFFFSLLVVCGKAIHNKQLEDFVSLFLFPPCNRQLHGCM